MVVSSEWNLARVQTFLFFRFSSSARVCSRVKLRMSPLKVNKMLFSKNVSLAINNKFARDEWRFLVIPRLLFISIPLTNTVRGSWKKDRNKWIKTLFLFDCLQMSFLFIPYSLRKQRLKNFIFNVAVKFFLLTFKTQLSYEKIHQENRWTKRFALLPPFSFSVDFRIMPLLRIFSNP